MVGKGSASERHAPVLRAEATSALIVDPGGTYLDATYGAGGHSVAILDALDAGAQLVAIDADPSTQESASEIVDSRFSFSCANYAELDRVLEEREALPVDGILMDLGMSSMQVDDAERGFSFSRPGPLDMRMDTSAGANLAGKLAKVSKRELARVLKEYGEERHARNIASRIIDLRDKGKLNSTADIAGACGGGRARRHNATRVFLALRIWVNNELDRLLEGLSKAAAALRNGGRLVVITFHSIEDRIVKRFIRPLDGQSGTLLRHGRPVRPSSKEIAANPRARSALMRVAVKAA